MQEKFKKTFKKVAAIGTGIAMLGMTLTGATALDLSNYPSGLGYGGSDTIVVMGRNADADNAAATSVVAGLPAGTGSGGGVLVEGGVDEEVPIGKNIADSNYIDSELEEDDVETLQDTKISFKSSDYDIREIVELSRKNSTATGETMDARSLGDSGVTVVSSLGSVVVGSGLEDDYETNVFLEVGTQNAIRYVYAFDDAINISKDVSTTDTLKLKFLGKTLKIVSTDSASPDSKFTAYVGNEYFVNQGESVIVDGKTITLDNVGSGGAIAINVDGVVEVISSGNTETVNGIEITNDEFFYTSAGKDQVSASLVIGKDASSTIQNGDYYPGGDEICSNNDPEDPDCWKWIVSGLNSGSSTSVTNPSNGSDVLLSGTVLGVGNYFTMNDDSDNPPGVGDCVSLPNNFVSICLDSLTVKDDDYMNLKIEYDSSASFTDVYPAQTSQPAIKIHSSESEGLKIIRGNLGTANITKDTKTDTVYLDYEPHGTSLGNETRLFYENSNNQIRYAGNITASTGAAISTWMEINYKDTKSTNIVFDLGATTNGNTTPINLTINVIGDNSNDLVDGWDDIKIGLTRSTTAFTGIGRTAASEEADDVIWCAAMACNQTIGTKDEDHRSLYGIIIRDPKSHTSNDEVELDIPGDQVFAKVLVSGSVVQKAGDSTTSSSIKFDDEITDLSAYNVVLVGGPCANSLTAQVMGSSTAWPACADGFTDGEAIIELKPNGNNYAIVAAGYSADDTRRAGLVLESHTDKLGTTVAGKNKVTVTGTGLDVSGITVA